MKRNLKNASRKAGRYLEGVSQSQWSAATPTTTRTDLPSRRHRHERTMVPGLTGASLPRGAIQLQQPSIKTIYSRYMSGTTNAPSSLPLSPFEKFGGARNSEHEESSSTTHKKSSTAITTSKSPQDVWRALSDKLLNQKHDKDVFAADDDDDDEIMQNNLKECIHWWSRQRPITRESQETCWALWKRWKEIRIASTVGESKDTTSAVLWLAVLDHWRLALSEGVGVVHGRGLPVTPEMILHEVRSLNLPLDNENDATVIKSYGMLMDGLARLGRPEEAERLLHSLHKRDDHGDDDDNGSIFDGHNSTVLWNTVIHAWARSKRPDAADRALSLLDRMEKESSPVVPDAITYSSVLEAFAEGQRESSSNDTDNNKLIDKVEDVFARAVDARKVSEVAWMHRLRVWGAVDKEKARSLLNSLRNKYLAAPRTELNQDDVVCTPNQQIFAVVMSAFAQAGDFDSVRELWNDIYELDERHHDRVGNSKEDSPFRPSPAALNAVLHAFSRAKIPDRAEKAQAFLEGALDISRNVVDRTSFNTVLDAWAGSRNRRNVEVMGEIMDFMRQSGDDLMPDTYTFNALLKAYSRSNRREALAESRRVLKGMWKSYRTGNQITKPNHVSYSTVLFAFSRLATPTDTKEAEAIFQELWNEYQRHNDPELCPSEASYVSIITMWIRSKRKEATSRAAYYFDHMRAKYLQTNDTRFQPSTRIYNTLIDSMKLSGDGLGAERALKRMIDDYRNGNTKAAPTTVSFNTVLTAWLKSTDKGRAPHRIEEILRDMEKLAKSEGWSCQPNTWTYTIVLEAWSALRSARGAERAEAIFRGLQKQYDVSRDESIRPCGHCYTTVMNSWAKSGSPYALEKTQQLFDEMMEKFEAGDDRLRPGAVAYIALLAAWSRSERSDAPTHVLGIFNEMADRHQLDPERYEKPDSWHYSAVINAFAERGDVRNAEAILKRVLLGRDGVRPNRGCWNGILKAYARSGAADAPERATEVLREMYAYSDQGYGESSPDAAVYTTLLEVWRCSGREDAFDKGCDLLREMLEEARTRKRLCPDAGVFLLLFRILNNDSRIPEKQEHAERLARLMNENNIRPTKALECEISKAFGTFDATK